MFAIQASQPRGISGGSSGYAAAYSAGFQGIQGVRQVRAQERASIRSYNAQMNQLNESARQFNLNYKLAQKQYNLAVSGQKATTAHNAALLGIRQMEANRVTQAQNSEMAAADIAGNQVYTDTGAINHFNQQTQPTRTETAEDWAGTVQSQRGSSEITFEPTEQQVSNYGLLQSLYMKPEQVKIG